MGVHCVGRVCPSLHTHPHCPHEVRFLSFRGDRGRLNPTISIQVRTHHPRQVEVLPQEARAPTHGETEGLQGLGFQVTRILFIVREVPVENCSMATTDARYGLKLKLYKGQDRGR